MKAKKVFKIIGIILLVLFIILLIHTARNFIIISKIQNNFSKYKFSDNYHIASISKESDDDIHNMNFYKKDNKQVSIIERSIDNKIYRISLYNNGEKNDIFWDNPEGKICQLDTESSIVTLNIVNVLDTDNIWQKIIGSLFSKIRSVTYNQKECYVVNNFMGVAFMNDAEKNELYIEKDTGLCIKSIQGNMENERQYEFNNVDDSIFIEPDISEYKVNSDNNIQNSDISINVLVKEIKNEYILGTNDKNEEIIIHIDKNTQVVGLGPYVGDYIQVYTSDDTIATTYPLQVFNVTKIVIDE